MKLLILEKEPDLRRQLMLYFKREGYLCEHGIDFREGYIKIVNHEYDCIILDPDLPGGDGLKLIPLMLEENNQTGIIVISWRENMEDKIHGLDQGADDYLVKPVQFPELNARIKAVMRRKTSSYSRELRFQGLIIRIDERSVEANGQFLRLTKKEFDILVYLARNRNRVVTKDSIAEHLWGDYMDEAVSFDFIYAHVKNLRKKLVQNGCGDYLKTIYGIGYKFVGS